MTSRYLVNSEDGNSWLVEASTPKDAEITIADRYSEQPSRLHAEETLNALLTELDSSGDVYLTP